MSRPGARKAAFAGAACSAMSTAMTPGTPAGKPFTVPPAGTAPTTIVPRSMAFRVSAASSGSAGPTRLRLITSARAVDRRLERLREREAVADRGGTARRRLPAGLEREQLHLRRDAHDAPSIVAHRGDHPGHLGAMPIVFEAFLVAVHEIADLAHPAREVRMAGRRARYR